jgi:hypothetical protein
MAVKFEILCSSARQVSSAGDCTFPPSSLIIVPIHQKQKYVKNVNGLTRERNRQQAEITSWQWKRRRGDGQLFAQKVTNLKVFNT